MLLPRRIFRSAPGSYEQRLAARPVRPLHEVERVILKALAAAAGLPAVLTSPDALDAYRVRDMLDAGMRSIRFVMEDENRRGARFSVAELCHRDSDGVPVSFALNLDDNNKPWEIDSFKADFSPLHLRPSCSDGRREAKPRLPKRKPDTHSLMPLRIRSRIWPRGRRHFALLRACVSTIRVERCVDHFLLLLLSTAVSALIAGCTVPSVQAVPEFIDLDLSKATRSGNSVRLADINPAALGPGSSFILRNGILAAGATLDHAKLVEQDYLDRLCRGQATIKYLRMNTDAAGLTRFSALVDCH